MTAFSYLGTRKSHSGTMGGELPESVEDMRLDPLLVLVVDRADRQIPFEFLERVFDLGELQVELPQLRRIRVGEVRAQEVAALAATDFLERRARYCAPRARINSRCASVGMPRSITQMRRALP